MSDCDVKIGKECVFALTSAWSEINYGIVVGSYYDESINRTIYKIYNADEHEMYYSTANFMRQYDDVSFEDM